VRETPELAMIRHDLIVLQMSAFGAGFTEQIDAT